MEINFKISKIRENRIKLFLFEIELINLIEIHVI